MMSFLKAIRAALAGWMPVLAILLPVGIGILMVVQGVAMVAGEGWAYIVAGLSLFGFAAIIRRGIYRV
jgi:hypothetical protein